MRHIYFFLCCCCWEVILYEIFSKQTRAAARGWSKHRRPGRVLVDGINIHAFKLSKQNVYGTRLPAGGRMVVRLGVRRLVCSLKLIPRAPVRWSGFAQKPFIINLHWTSPSSVTDMGLFIGMFQGEPGCWRILLHRLTRHWGHWGVCDQKNA